MITKKTFNIKKTKENEKPIYLKKNINFRRNNN